MKWIERAVSVRWSLPLIAAAFVSLAIAGIACRNSTAGQASCSENTDCEVGYACGAEGTCVQTPCDEVPGKGCGEEDLICLKTDEYPEGVCSRPECESASDCDNPGDVCVEGRCTQEECSVDGDCDPGERCNAFGQCTPTTDGGTSDDVGVDGSSDGGTTDATDGGDVTYMCDQEPEECPTSASPDADKWSERYCACVECTGDSDCEESGYECRAGTCQPECTQECDSASGGESCPSDKPFCISDCCVECVGAMDCMESELCVDGQCQEESSGDCTSDSCPDGYSCNTSTGKCEQSSSGAQCSESDPSCPDGEYCNTDTNKCEPVSGGGDCGGCNAGCTCPGSLTCDQQLFLCVGCNPPLDPNCPNGTCFPLGGQNVCL